MTPFVPKHVPYREAMRIVAERVDLKEGQLNPLESAYTEGAIVAEVDRHNTGKWKQLPTSSWATARIYTGPERPPVDPDSKLSRYQFGLDQVRFLMADIDDLWSPVAGSVMGLAVPPDDDRYAFVRMQIDAIKHFESIGKHPPKKADLEQYFLDLKQLPGGTRITPRLADMMATLSRSPRAMKGGIKKLTNKGPKSG